jgi:hypothetical protein
LKPEKNQATSHIAATNAQTLTDSQLRKMLQISQEKRNKKMVDALLNILAIIGLLAIGGFIGIAVLIFIIFKGQQ